MDIQAETTLFRTTVMRLHQLVDKFKLSEGVSEVALGALSVFSQQLEGFTHSLSQHQISRVVPNVAGDVKAAVSVLSGKSRFLESALVATHTLAEKTQEELDKVEEEFSKVDEKLKATTPFTTEEKATLEAKRNRLEIESLKKKSQLDLCGKEAFSLKEVVSQLQSLERKIHPNHTVRQSSEIREGKPKWIGVRWNKDRKIVAAMVFRDFVLSPLRLAVSLLRMSGTFMRSTWANLADTISSPSVFRVVTGFLLVGFSSVAAFAIGSVMAVGRGLYRTGVNFIAVAGLPWKAGENNWVRKVGEGRDQPPFAVQISKGFLGGIAPKYGHVMTTAGEELTSCIEGEDEWIDGYWTKWDSWVENVVSRLGPPSNELHRQNLGDISSYT